MDDLISRQALMKEFSDFVRASNNSDFARTPTWNDAVSLVGSMPSAQPQKVYVAEIKVEGKELQRCIDKAVGQIKVEEMPEIIRCKDCKYWESDYGYCHEQGAEGLKQDDYCSYAERREE